MGWTINYVSILILLDSILLLQGQEQHMNLLPEFQSLFYWILFSYANFLKRNEACKVGFNPYSIGFYSLIRSTEQTLYFQLL